MANKTVQSFWFCFPLYSRTENPNTDFKDEENSNRICDFEKTHIILKLYESDPYQNLWGISEVFLHGYSSVEMINPFNLSSTSVLIQ